MIHWVRHGQSTWNVAGRLQGHELSPPLTDRGRRQAGWAAERLAEQGATRVVSSPAVRARQTAEIIAARVGCVVGVDPRLLEMGLDEDRPAVQARVRELLEDGLADGTVAVSHGDTIALAIEIMTGRMPTLPENGSISQADPATRTVRVLLPPGSA